MRLVIVVCILGLVGVVGCGDDEGGATERGAAGTAGGAAAGGSGGAAESPLVDAALADACPVGSKPPDTGVTPGDDLHKVTLDAYPDAVCNDGTPAIMYVRKSATAAAEGDWVIHLQAGGSCGSWEACRDRWCSFKSPYDAAKMSSRYAPEVSNGSGLLVRSGLNTFGGANQVFVYYCSSDSWTGRRSDVVLDDPDLEGPSFRLHFRGFDILQAVVTALSLGVTSDDGAEVLPRLTTAARVLYSGSSAGSTGATQSLDWFRAQVPNALVAGAFDAIFDPLPEDIDDPEVRAKWILGLETTFTNVDRALYDAHTDESCEAAHPGADAYLCRHNGHVRLNHLTTPFFNRQDLRDPVQFGYFQATGATLDQFASALHNSVSRLPDIQTTAEEKAMINLAPGVVVHNCQQHIVLLNGQWFGTAQQDNATVETDDGTPLTLHDALGAWIAGTAVTAIDTHPSTVSACATPNSDQ